MNHQALSSFIWLVADLLRGDYKQSEYGKVILHAIMDALDTHTAMSSQALISQRIQEGLKDTLLGPAQLYEALRARNEPTQSSRL